MATATVEIVALNDPKAVSKAIDKAITSSGNLSVALHLAAFNCLVIAANGSNDIRPLNRLYAGMSANAKAALRVWAVKFGKFRYDGKKDVLSFAKTGAYDLGGAREMSPMDYIKAKKKAEKQDFDAAAFKLALVKLVERAEKNEISGPLYEIVKRAVK